MPKEKNIVIAVHGGAGTILRSSLTSQKEKEYKDALHEAVNDANVILTDGGSSTDAVTAAVVSLENSHLFNAGKGSVFTSEGLHEMDASIMEGANRNAGAVAGVRRIQNPVLLAKEVMDFSEHVMLLGKGAEEFAKIRGFKSVDDEYFFDQYRYLQWKKIRGTNKTQLDHTDDSIDNKYGTVGAVALDMQGHVAAATSTGGLTNKMYGRIGDSGLIGIGNYANDLTCAVSCTGHGEYFIRGVAAYDISCLIEYKGFSLADACEEVIHKRLPKLGGDGGVIAVNKAGEVALTFNSEGMYRGYQVNGGKVVTRIFE